MYSPFKMKPKSPILKALIGNQKNLNAGLRAAIEASPATMKKESPTKKKTEREKLNKLVDKRTKLRDKKAKREDKEKNTRRVDRKLEKNQAKINANSKAQEDKNKKNKQVEGERMVPKRRSDKDGVKDLFIKTPVTKSPGKTPKAPPAKMKKESMAKMKKESSMKMMKKSPTKMAKKSPAKREKPYHLMSLGEKLKAQQKKRGGTGKKKLTVANVKKSLGNLNENIKKGADNVSRVIKGENKDGTSKGGLVIRSKKDETTGRRSTTITRKNNTDKKSSTTPPPAVNPPASNGYKKIKGESRYSYKKNTKTGGYDFIDSKDGSKGTIKSTNKKAMDHINSAFPMKKKSSMKMMKKK